MSPAAAPCAPPSRSAIAWFALRHGLLLAASVGARTWIVTVLVGAPFLLPALSLVRLVAVLRHAPHQASALGWPILLSVTALVLLAPAADVALSAPVWEDARAFRDRWRTDRAAHRAGRPVDRTPFVPPSDNTPLNPGWAAVFPDGFWRHVGHRHVRHAARRIRRLWVVAKASHQTDYFWATWGLLALFAVLIGTAMVARPDLRGALWPQLITALLGALVLLPAVLGMMLADTARTSQDGRAVQADMDDQWRAAVVRWEAGVLRAVASGAPASPSAPRRRM